MPRNQPKLHDLSLSACHELLHPRLGDGRWRGVLPLPALLAALSVTSACAMQADGEGEGDDEALGSVAEPLTAVASASNIAFHWAPRHIQDIDKSSMSGKSDFISRANYDGDFVSTNNWDNLNAFNTPSFAYYAVTESTTHFFIYYMFFHPRDWASSFAEEHENDAEGVLVFVRKDGSAFGKFEGMVTQAHGNFYLYRDAGVALGKGSTNKTVYVVDRVIATPLESHARPATYQETEGHGMYGCGTHITNCVRADDGIKYVPSLTNAAIPPAAIPNGQQVEVGYRLIDITQPGELFSHRLDANTFLNGKTFKGDQSGGCGAGFTTTCATNSAGAIWGWDPAFSLDPAAFIRQNFNFGALTPPSSTYLRNDFVNGHDICQEGAPLANTGSCVSQICGVDPFCCNSGWDQACVAETASVCGLECVTSAHSVCTVGAALTSGASHCTSEVCAADAFCCNNSWDDICVGEAKSMCSLCL